MSAASKPQRARASVLDRLLDAEPQRARDRTKTASQTVEDLRSAVQRDVEHLLNARRPWRSVAWPALRTSPLGYGVPDLTAGAFNDEEAREDFRAEIEDAIRRFEPRLAEVQVRLAEKASPLRATLALSIGGLLMIDPSPEPISFDTLVDTTTADVVLRLAEEA